MIEFEQMDDRELDATIAEMYFGWRVGGMVTIDGIVEPVANKKAGYMFPPDADMGEFTDAIKQVPHYSISRDHAAIVEAEIARRGLKEKYVFALGIVLEEMGVIDIDTDGNDDILWKHTTADPRNRCLAAARVLSKAETVEDMSDL